jgi:sodium-coupled neutral amino acid transporter 11
MAKASIHGGANTAHPGSEHANENSSSRNQEEDIGLLGAGPNDNSDDGDDDIIVHSALGVNGASENNATSTNLAAPGQPKTPRTPNRVRFNLEPTVVGADTSNGTAHDDHHHYARDSFDIDDEDPLTSSSSSSQRGNHHRVPLLTGIEAPSVTVANESENAHSLAEEDRARPRSGLRSAFMNMANSIIGAGIIGQPYAFKQAGLLSGIFLLVALTVVVDWTIRLIVVNSKLSGASSFQGTVEKCFGRTGLIAISLAQWVFAFGGMVAFGVIVGDSIPHVLSAIWPGLREVPVLWLFADRRGVIVLFTLGISYPLTLYRDIAKVSSPLTGLSCV